MSPNRISSLALREAPDLGVSDTVETAVRYLVDTGLPALPVTGKDGGFAGIFGEREFMGALFPGYLDQLRGVKFLRRSLDETIDKREACRHDTVAKYMNTEHVDVGPDFADAEVAEIFLHHRVLLVPVADQGTVVGVITRGDFFRTVARRFLG